MRTRVLRQLTGILVEMVADLQTWQKSEKRLLAFIRKRVTDPNIAQDIVQDLFLQYYQRSHELKDPSRLESWLFRIARNLIADTYRRASRKIPDLTEDASTLNTECAASCLRNEIRALPEMNREVLEKVDIQSLSQKQLAEVTGLSYTTLKSRVQRSRELLRRRMTAKYQMEIDVYGNVMDCRPRQGDTCSL